MCTCMYTNVYILLLCFHEIYIFVKIVFACAVAFRLNVLHTERNNDFYIFPTERYLLLLIRNCLKSISFKVIELRLY